MDVQTAIHERCSILTYKDQAVEEEKLRIILDAGRFSPSAKNRQAIKFIVVRNLETRQRLVVALNGVRIVAEAPLVIVACATEQNQARVHGQFAGAVDASNAIAYMILQAHELGLGTCWLVVEREDPVKEVLGIPGSVRVAGVATLGYPAQAPEPILRKPLEEIVCYERYS
jgi:nitroreductase